MLHSLNAVLLVSFFASSSGYYLIPTTLRNRMQETHLASSSRGNRDPPFTHNVYVELQDKDDDDSSRVSVSQESNVVLRGGMGIGLISGLIEQFVNGYKARKAYDSTFQTKISVEMLVGFATQLAAEVGKRGANSLAEIDFIIAE